MGFDPASPEMAFLLVMLHTGTTFSVLIYFWPRWRRLLFPAGATTGPAGKSAASHFLKMVILATACTGVLGLAVVASAYESEAGPAA